MLAFPFVIQYNNEDNAWIISNVLVFLIGILYLSNILINLIIGICVGLQMSVNLGLAGMLEPMFIGSMLQGQAMSSIITLFIKLICLLIFDSSDQFTYFYGSLLFFIITAIIMTINLISLPVSWSFSYLFQYFFGSEYVRYYIKKRQTETATIIQQEQHLKSIVIKQGSQIEIK